MMRKQYQVLYLFENKKSTIVKIKLTNVISQDESKIYKWLFYDKENDMLLPLVLKEKRTEKNKEFRDFDECSLTFDTKKAGYERNGKRFEFYVASPSQPLSQKLTDSIDDYLLLLNFRNAEMQI